MKATNGGKPVLRLRYIHRGDFRKSEWTLTQEALQVIKGLKLGPEDCIMLLSGTGKMIKFVFGLIQHDGVMDSGGHTRTAKMLPSRTYRMVEGGTFHPLMIANYADELGLTLEGLKKLDKYLEEERQDYASKPRS